MFDSFENHAGGARQNGGFAVLDCNPGLTGLRKSIAGQGPTFSKVFRWQPSDLSAPMPATVELVGSFTSWQVEAMKRDAVTNTWQLTLHRIPGNRTHRYMLLVNGAPAQDKNCDGLATAEGFEEQQYQLMTARGPRIFLLFAQTK